LPSESRRKLLNFATHPVTKFLTKLAGGARGQAVTELFEGLHDREAANEGALLNDVLNFADLTPEEVAAKIDADPRLEELLLEALAIAGRTRQPQLRTTLARIAAKGL